MHIYIAPARHSHQLQEPPRLPLGLQEESVSFDGLQEERARFLLPENADLAQALLEIIISKSCLERFSPNGGGAVVIVLEDWQIEILEGFGVLFKQGPQISPNNKNQIIEANNVAKPEYISIDDNISKRKIKNGDEKLKIDILSDWLRI